jgi:hypothetical protein
LKIGRGDGILKRGWEREGEREKGEGRGRNRETGSYRK